MVIFALVVTDRTFSSAKQFGRTSTVWFGPNDRTFFSRTQNKDKSKVICEKKIQFEDTTFKIVLLVRSGVSAYRGSSLSTIFRIWKKSYYAKFVLEGTT